MENVSGHPRLYRRGAIYYHRAAVPVDLTPSYPKREEVRSLKTSDYREALRLVRIEAARVDELFSEHRRRMAQASGPVLSELDDAIIRRVGEAYYAHLLEEDDETRLAGFAGERRRTIRATSADIVEVHGFRHLSFEEAAEERAAQDESLRWEYARGHVDAFFMDEVAEVLSWSPFSLRLDPKSPSWKRVARELQTAALKANIAIRSRNAGDPVETPVLPLSPAASSAPISRPEARGPLLSKVVKEWYEEKSRTAWAPKTAREHLTWINQFIYMHGDAPLNLFGKDQARSFKAMLLKLPANWNKHIALKGLTISEASERAAELGLKPMSDENINKILRFVGSFWTWAESHIDGCPPPLFRGLQLKMSGRKVRDERNPFSIEELRSIFSTPLFTGCASLSRWKKPGTVVPRDRGVFWVPLISLFSGARSGEIIQLYTTDIREEGGAWYFDINAEGEDKGLKTLHSKRMIPIHPTLVELGFLDHVEIRRRRGDGRLFPEMERGEDGYYSSPFSKHFGRFLKATGVKTRKNAFHSFRHSFEDACRDSDIPKEIMDALQGHGERGMSGRYGRGFALKKLDEAMRQIHYDGLDLSHLLPARRK